MLRRRGRQIGGLRPVVIGEWAPGTNTNLSIAGGRARATRSGGNPRIRRQVNFLIPGGTYRVQTNMYKGTASGDIFFRAATTSDLTTGDLMNVISSTDAAVDSTFTAPANGIAYIGMVAVCNANGQFAECDETFTLTRV